LIASSGTRQLMCDLIEHPSSWGPYLDLAANLECDGSPEAAERILVRLIRIVPGEPQAYLLAARLAMARSDTAKAAPLASRALMFAPNLSPAYEILAQRLSERQRPARAIRACFQAFTAEPASPSAFERLMQELMRANEFTRMIRFAGDLAMKFPNQAQIYFWLGRAKRLVGYTADAEADLDRALSLDPNFATMIRYTRETVTLSEAKDLIAKARRTTDPAR
jgi:tetratricopeptide (TPR) repeat protein